MKIAFRCTVYAYILINASIYITIDSIFLEQLDIFKFPILKVHLSFTNKWRCLYKKTNMNSGNITLIWMHKTEYKTLESFDLYHKINNITIKISNRRLIYKIHTQGNTSGECINSMLGYTVGKHSSKLWKHGAQKVLFCHISKFIEV